MHMYVYMHVCTLHIVLCTCASPCTPSYILYGHATHAASLLAVKEANYVSSRSLEGLAYHFLCSYMSYQTIGEYKKKTVKDMTGA